MLRRLLLICTITSVAAAQGDPSRKDIPAIAKAANESVVSIVMSDKDGKPLAQGSGFFVSKDGIVVTNYHVISEGSSAVVKLPDGAFYVVDGVLASDKVRDIAVIKAHGQDFRTLKLGNSDRVQVGEEVVAIGNPLSLESTVSNGIVSGIRTAKELGGKFLQVTAPISPGSSGGPLFNMTGEVIGITTLYLKGGENLNFAIPVNDAKRLIQTGSTKLQQLPNEPELVTTTESPEPDLEQQWVVVKETSLYSSLIGHKAFDEVIRLPRGEKVEKVGSPDNGWRRVFVPTGGFWGYVSYDAVSNDEETMKRVKLSTVKFDADTSKFYCSGDKEVVGYLIFVPAGKTVESHLGNYQGLPFHITGPVYLIMTDKMYIEWNAVSGKDNAIKAGFHYFTDLCAN